MTNYKNGIASYGAPLTGAGFIPGPNGEVLFVDYATGSDSNSGKTWNTAVKTLSQAHTLVTTNANSIIYINGYSTVVETAMVDFTKSRVTVIGVGGAGHFGAAAKVSCTLSSGATNIATFKNTGVRNTFIGIKFMNANTVAQGLYSVAEGGEYSTYVRCEFYKSTDLDDAGASELLDNGDSASFYDCTFGSTANETGNIRANVLVSATLSGKKCRDNYFENCLFWAKADDTDKVFVYGANATDVERMFMMKDCTFFNTELASGVPANAVDFGAKQTEGLVFLKNCSAVNCTDLCAADKGIWVDGAAPTEGSSGIAVEDAS